MVTKEKFLAYYTVQMEGKYNMIMDANAVMEITGLTQYEYIDIIHNYQKYFNLYIK